MLIYHGSDHIIEHPSYHGGKRHNDYGFGFYCTEIPDMAREWASASDRNGYMNAYEIDDSELTILDLNDYPILVWLAVLLENREFIPSSPLAREAKEYLIRTFSINYEEYDLIRGYRADDSYFSFAQDFINGTISVEQLSNAMRLGSLGNQLVLKSERSYRSIEYTGAEEVDSTIWFPKRSARDDKARSDYHSIDKAGYIRGAVYITKILDEEMKPDDPRLQ